MNIAVVQGRVRANPDRRWSREEALLVSFDVVADGSPACRVPVTWIGPAHKVPKAIGDGKRVTVIGTVRRRFYRRGGATLSQTDIRADRVLSGTGHRATAAAMAAVQDQLGAANAGEVSRGG